MNNISGNDRVLEPKGYIPTAAWKVDNRRDIAPNEIRISVSMVRLEELNFRQLCNECNYHAGHICSKVKDCIRKRGKLHNPITDSAGICCGFVEQIGEAYSNPRNLRVGDKVICSTSMTSIPIHIDEILEIDFNHATMKVKGYAIGFETSTIFPFPRDLEAPYTLAAMDEVGSLQKAYELTGEVRRVLILGDGLLTMMLYGAAVRKAIRKDGYVIAVMDKASASNLSSDEIHKVMSPYVDQLYFTDVLQPVKSYDELCLSEPEPFDLSINCANMLGGEVLSVMLTKDKGEVFFTSLVSNLNMATLFAESMSKEVTMIPVEEYRKGFEVFTENLIRCILPELSVVEEIYRSHNIIRQLPINAAQMALEKRSHQLEGFVFGSEKTRLLLQDVLNVASYDCNVIIEGETGVGKEKVLEVLQKNSSRRAKPCVKINCATVLENLAESEFFGYEPNSFTGAGNKGKPGYFELAHTGILFLDEIGALSLNLQTKLLRVLQENQFYRVGGQTPVDVDVRVICANNVSIKELVRAGKFREDLYYRLSVCEIFVPPLRDRVEDIVCLAETFLKDYCRQYGISKSFTPDALETMKQYIWPGNVRELDNVVHRLAVNVKRDMIMESDVLAAIRNGVQGSKDSMTETDWELFRKNGLKTAIGDVEKEIIASALQEYGSTRAAAKALRISQSQFMRKKKKYNL